MALSTAIFNLLTYESINRDQVRILDFGIAKALSLSRYLTRNDFGSASYSSPERLK